MEKQLFHCLACPSITPPNANTLISYVPLSTPYFNSATAFLTCSTGYGYSNASAPTSTTCNNGSWVPLTASLATCVPCKHLLITLDDFCCREEKNLHLTIRLCYQPTVRSLWSVVVWIKLLHEWFQQFIDLQHWLCCQHDCWTDHS